jgi:hypothetical protein
MPKYDENNAGKITGMRTSNTVTRVQKKTT